MGTIGLDKVLLELSRCHETAVVSGLADPKVGPAPAILSVNLNDHL